MRPLLFFAAGIAMVFQDAQAMTFQSGPQQVALIELFSSEGCSSCPPAERWLSALRDEPGLWREFVPLSFHVDYWNRLGWTDRFSKNAYTARQSEYARIWGTSSVYTPCFVKNGEEWKADHASSPTPKPAGILSASVEGEALVSTYAPGSATAATYEIHAAILGCDLSSKITSGENQGATLRHDFVVLDTVHGAAGEKIHLSRQAGDQAPRLALAVWVTLKGELKPLQATGGWLK